METEIQNIFKGGMNLKKEQLDQGRITSKSYWRSMPGNLFKF